MPINAILHSVINYIVAVPLSVAAMMALFYAWIYRNE